jgi:hypothetical protein
MILARRSSPAPSARHICRTRTKIKLNSSPAFGILSHPLGEEPSPVGAAYSAGQFSTQRRKGAKAQGIFALRPLRLGVFALILSLMIPLLTELDSFTPPFLQKCQSYGLPRLRVLRATKNSNANRPKRPPQNDFGTAFVLTGQPEINCVAADVSPLPLKKPPAK